MMIRCEWEGNRGHSRKCQPVASGRLLLNINISCRTLKAGTHYPCSLAVFTGREHSRSTRCHFGHPWTRSVDTAREHGR